MSGSRRRRRRRRKKRITDNGNLWFNIGSKPECGPVIPYIHSFTLVSNEERESPGEKCILNMASLIPNTFDMKVIKLHYNIPYELTITAMSLY